jgi:hypothetical protein
LSSSRLFTLASEYVQIDTAHKQQLNDARGSHAYTTHSNQHITANSHT